MKTLLRYFLINLASLWVTTNLITGLTFTGGLRALLLGGVVFSAINLALVPLLRILLLPLNLLTLGLFTWLVNVLALYALTKIVNNFELHPFYFEGLDYNGFIIPSFELNTFMVAILASFMIGVITHFLQWLSH